MGGTCGPMTTVETPDLSRQHVIRERYHRIHDPFSVEKLAVLGGALRLREGDRILDLACGSGETLCTWARDHQIGARALTSAARSSLVRSPGQRSSAWPGRCHSSTLMPLATSPAPSTTWLPAWARRALAVGSPAPSRCSSGACAPEGSC